MPFAQPTAEGRPPRGLRGLLEAAPDAIVVTDHTGEIVYLNAQTEKLFGYTRDELSGSSVHLLLPEGRREAKRQHDQKLEADPSTRPMTGATEVPARRKDGSRFVAELSLGTLDSEGASLAVVFVRDMTEHHRIQDTIRKSEAYFRLLSTAGERLARSLDYLQTLRNTAELAVPEFADWCCVVPVGSDGVRDGLVTAHRTGIRPEAVDEFFRHHRQHFKDPTGHFSRALSSGRPICTTFATDIAAGSGMPASVIEELAPRSLLYIPLIARECPLGVLVCCVSTRWLNHRRYGEDDLCIATDLGHRAAGALDNALLLEKSERARQASQRAAEARDQVLAIVAHDLRSPLNTIGLCAQRLISTAGRPAQLICSSVQQMNILIEDLLTEASFEAGVLSIVRALHSVEETVAQVVESFTPQATAGGLLILGDVSDCGQVWSDRVRLMQVLGNLAANAVKFTPAGGSITIQARPEGEAVRFAVIDTGAGIPPEARARVFDRNWQERGALVRQGLGLGLYIARLLVEAHGSEITVASEVGAGSTFSFLLPSSTASRPRPAF